MSSSEPMSRIVNGSLKLNSFHYMIKQAAGYLLHPAISIASKPFRVVDFGAHTAVWPTDVADTFGPDGASVYGIDLTDKDFPPLAWRPQNLKLYRSDVLQSWPDDDVGSYDLVHMRWWLSQNRQQVRGLLERASTLLKPGGYVQWFEHDKEATRPVTAVDGLSTDAVQHFVDIVRNPFAGYEHGWIHYIPSVAEELALEVIAVDQVKFKPSMYTQLNDIHVLGLEDVPRGAIPTIDTFKDKHMSDFVRELQSGASTNYEYKCFVLRKPFGSGQGE